MPDSSCAVKVKLPTTVTYPYDLSQAWVPLPPGITGLRAAPAPVPDATYGQIITPTALLRPYQEQIAVDAVVKIGFKEQRLEYPMTLPTRDSTMRIRAIGAPTLHVGDFSSALAPKVKTPTISREVFRAVSFAPRVQFPRITVWSPLDLTPTVWLDASDASTITETSGTVSEWRDKSGNSYHYQTEGTTTRCPTLVPNTQNSLPALVFDGTDDRFTSTANMGAALGIDSLGAGNFTVIAVANPTSVTAYNALLDTFPQYSDAVWQIGYEGLYLRTGSGGDVRAYISDASSANVPWAVNTCKIAVIIGASPRSIQLNNETASTEATPPSWLATDTSPMRLGRSLTSGGSPPTGFIGMNLCEMIMVPRVITSPERTSVVNYLAAKWGITV